MNIVSVFVISLRQNNGYLIMPKLNRIKIVLAERDLNNKWLADRLGKDQATVSKWITNTTQPSLQMLLDIAAVLKVPVQDLLRQDEYNQEIKVLEQN